MFAHKYGAKDSSLYPSYCISKKSSQVVHKNNIQSYFSLSLCVMSYGFRQVHGEILGRLLGASHAGVEISSANGNPRRETCCSDNKASCAKYPRKFWIDLNVTGN